MDYINRSIEMKWPLFLLEIIFIVGGVLLIISGVKTRKQTPVFAWISLLTGILIAGAALYLLFWTFIIGYNS